MRFDTHAADYCPTCGQPRDLPIATTEKFGIQLSGINVLSFASREIRIRPACGEFMRALLERGKASRELLFLRISPDVESNVVDVYACKLRKVIRELTAGKVELRTVWGWGYELVEPPIAWAA